VPDEPATPTERAEIELTTFDGLTIAGTWQAAMGVTGGPGVLLLHQVDAAAGEGHDRYDWSGTFDPLVEAGVTVLAIDFRSHGASDAATIPLIDLGSDREQLRYDVQAGLDFLDDRQLEVADDKIGVAGLGLGATMAVVAANMSGDMPSDWGVRGLAAVSGRLDRAVDLNPGGDANLSLANGLYVAGQDNANDAQSAEDFYYDTTGDRTLLLVPDTAAHGADLHGEFDQVGAAIVDHFTDLWPPEETR
jgi:pimeloyl-ACP methyl ester carboxylesterase